MGTGETWSGQPHTWTRPFAVSEMKILLRAPTETPFG